MNENNRCFVNTSIEDRKCINYVTAYLIVQALNYYVKLILIDFNYWSYISKAILAFYLINALTVILKKQCIKFIGTEVILLICFLYTYIIGDINEDSFSSIVVNTIGVFIPLSFSVLSISEFRLFQERLYKSSWLISVILLAIAVQQKASIYNYNMPLSYAIVLQLLIVLDHYFYERKWYDLLTTGILFFAILIVGSRGPILCVLVYLMLKIVLSNSINMKRRTLFIIIAIVISGLLIINSEYILLNTIEMLNKYGISSRSLYYLYTHNNSDSGRGEIYKLFYSKIISGPLLGYGIAGGWVNSNYPHNIFIEIILSYGLILGSFLAILYIFITIKGVRLKDNLCQRLAMIFVSYSVSLLISNSFILEPIFFITIPLCLLDTRFSVQVNKGDNNDEKI